VHEGKERERSGQSEEVNVPAVCARSVLESKEKKGERV